MDCIRCHVPMKAVMANGVEIDQCQDCGGIWFDLGELDWLVDIPKLAIEDKRNAHGDVDDTKRAPCPRCGGTGNMIQLARLDSEFHIDACPTCSGRWLDGGELNTLRSLERQKKLRGFLNGNG